MLTLDANLYAWMPGERTLDTRLTVPPGAPGGTYELAIGVLDPHSRAAEVKLANAGMTTDGWYPVSTLAFT
jgi:hypothetical protein